MINEIILMPIQIKFAGKEFGNMAFKYGDRQEVQSRRDKIESLYSESTLLGMDTSGGNKLLDLDTINTDLSWNWFECDGLFTNNPRVCLVLLPADCIPLVIYSVKNNNLGLIHVSHKNAKTGIHIKALQHMISARNENIDDLRFYIGPSISKESYYFKDIEQEQKNSAEWQPFIDNYDGNYHIDLKGFVVQQLINCDVEPSSITNSNINTYGDEYYSHRQSVLEKTQEGRNLFAVSFVNK
ncbi:MAG: polyphenol oxidase family protein [bacterium]